MNGGLAIAAFGGDAAPDPGPCTGAASTLHAPCGAPETSDRRIAPSAWELAGEASRDRARARLDAVIRSDRLHAAGVSRAQADAVAATEAGVSVAVVASWRRRVPGLSEGGRVAALLDGTRTGRPSAIDGTLAWRSTLEALAFHHGPHLTAAHARRTLIARHGQAPSLRAVRRWLAQWRNDNARDLSAVTNPDRHRSHRGPAGGDAGAAVDRLNRLWELDSTICDVICADGRRHALCAAIDVWSRRARVLIVPTSRAAAIAALLRRCLLDWGVPEVVRTDEGADYTSRHVLGVLADLEIAHDPCPPYTPEAKPFVERFIGTIGRDLFAFLPGFAGHDVAQAQALRARKSFARRRGETPAVTLRASLCAEELQARCDSWCEAVYGRRPHAGLDGATPFGRACSWSGPIRRVHDERALDALLAEPAGKGTRVVGKDGIRLANIDYIAPEIGSLIKQRVRVRRDPADPSRIHVYRADGGFVCVAEDPARTGADRAAIAARMKATANAANRTARKRARDLARREHPETAMDEVLAHAAAKASKVAALPRPGTAHETPALAEAARAADAAHGAARNATPAKPGARTGRSRFMAALIAAQRQRENHDD